jgi:hypothetical protein
MLELAKSVRGQTSAEAKAFVSALFAKKGRPMSVASDADASAQVRAC